MCLIAFAWRVDPRYPLVVAANRDEFHARPTAAMAPWAENPDVIGGRDLRAGGAWLGLRAGGRWAAVTNVRGPYPEVAPASRGFLVRDFLLRGGRAASAAGRVDGERYGGFNLLLGDGNELIWVGNQPVPARRGVLPGVHAVSNGAPSFVAGNACWPKMRHAIDGLRGWLRTLPARDEPDPEPLLALLADERGAPDSELPDTGVGIALERRLAPIFVRGERYGTRCSSVALLAADGSAVMIERRFGPGGGFAGETRLTLPPGRSPAGVSAGAGRHPPAGSRR